MGFVGQRGFLDASLHAVDFLEEICLECYKLASHSITNLPLLEYVASKKKPIIFSTGMCTLNEIDQAVDFTPDLVF